MTPNDTIEGELARVREWAKDQLAYGGDQPWSSFLLTRLGETIDALLAGMAATRAVDAQRASVEPGLRLVASQVHSHPVSKARVAEPVS